QGDTLVVETPRPFFGMSWWFGGSGRALLTLPASLQGLDAVVSVSAGDFRVDGEFSDLTVDLSAGRATVHGAADAVDADVSAGAVDLVLADVRTADFDVSAGS